MAPEGLLDLYREALNVAIDIKSTACIEINGLISKLQETVVGAFRHGGESQKKCKYCCQITRHVHSPLNDPDIGHRPGFLFRDWVTVSSYGDERVLNFDE